MKIADASYSLSSSHSVAYRDESQESLRTWSGTRRADSAVGNGAAVSLSAAARKSLAADIQSTLAALSSPQSSVQAPEVAAIQAAAEAIDKDPMLRLIRSLLEMLTGETIRLFSATGLPRANSATASTTGAAAASGQTTATPQAAGSGVEYDYHAVHEEWEQTKVSASGTIKTTDGLEISFTLDLSMTRTFRQESSVSLRAGDAPRKDPLVLNFDGAAAQLSDRHFAFDLDGNGAAEKLALLTSGSGYLALDRNANGKIDSGTELFGPASNAGFAELAALDSDGNGWIDENDRVFKDLRVWTPDATGAGRLETLAQRQVGAIALASVASPFELRGAANGKLGAIAATSLFLGTDGRVGSIQEVDLTV